MGALNRVMIDVHTHILPRIDDGSKDLNMTARMIAEEAAQGVRLIMATPHFYAHRTKIDEFLDRRARRMHDVQAMIDEAKRQQTNSADGTSADPAITQAASHLAKATDPLPRIRAGAEVYYFPGIGTASQIEQLCVEGTDILLLEMPFTQWTAQEYRDVYALIKKKHLRIVLAHIDRYFGLQKKKQIWEEIMNLPLTRQINAEAFLNGGAPKRFALKFIRDHSRVVLGSDCHNLDSRKPNLKEARAFIEKKLGTGVLEKMDATTAELYGE